MPSCEHGVVPPCAIVIPVQCEKAVKLLAVVFIMLPAAAGTLAKQRPEGIVVAGLLHSTIGRGYHTHVALMVGEVEVICRPVIYECHVATVEKDALRLEIIIDYVAANCIIPQLGYALVLVCCHVAVVVDSERFILFVPSP